MSKMDQKLVFAPLGGTGEIGMNLTLYGLGSGRRKSWLAVDMGVSFAGEDLPGVDLILPDIKFLVEEKQNLAGLVLTHGHEDHIGAIIDLWPQLECPIYATPFTAALVTTKQQGGPGIPLTTVPVGGRLNVGPFDVEYLPVSHSIPESHALAIRTPLGTILHTGDWKLDETPLIGLPTQEARFRALGEEGVLAMVCDSTNALREGRSPSEADVAEGLKQVIAAAPHRVAVTTFASNVARMRSVALAAIACEREIVVVGRAMERVVSIAREMGMLDGLPPFRSTESYDQLPRGKVVVLLTGSQGEPRAALARVAEGNHPDIALDVGDRLIMSSRTIPGNEKAVSRILNALVRKKIDVITDQDALVHTSGHPRRDELRKMYEWVRPKIAIPVHGEAMHQAAHGKLATEMGVKHVYLPEDGDVIELAPEFHLADNVPAGRLYKDGRLLVSADAPTLPERRKLSFCGILSVALAIDAKGELADDPQVLLCGLPDNAGSGQTLEDLVFETVENIFNALPRPRRKDPEAVIQSIERGVRNTVNTVWGKKPVCHVLVSEV